MLKQPNPPVEAEAIFKKVVKAAKKATKYVFDEDLSFIDGKYVITIFTDIPEGVGDIAETIIAKSERGMHVETECYPGQFDWASDTYIKDQVLIWFRF